MQTIFWDNAITASRLGLCALALACCAALPAAADGTPPAASGVPQTTAPNGNTDGSTPVLQLGTKAGKTRLEIRFPGQKAQTLALQTDGSINPKSTTANVALVATAPRKMLVIQDTYASRPGPLSMCQAGQETFLRVISTSPAKEVLRLKLASCRENIELASPGLEWQSDTATLKIHWLSGPNQGITDQTLRIDPDGKATLSPP